MGKIEYAKGIRGDQDEVRIRGFFDTMIETVVQILVHDKKNMLVAVFSGTYINEKGDILTSNNILPRKFSFLTIVPPGKGKDYIVLEAASDIYRSETKNLALIRSQDTTIDHQCVTFADAEEIQSGITVRMLSHRSETLSFSITAGKTSDLGDYLSFYARLPEKLMDKPDKEHHHLKGCDRKLHLIELTGLSGDINSIGTPVFNNFGKMIGIYICLGQDCHYEYATNVDVVKEFLKEYESTTPRSSSEVQKGDTGKGKRMQGRGSHGKQKN